jgi:hypothetical protein
MGFLTLGDFQDELAMMIGEDGPGKKRSSKRLTRYINMGYFELTGTQEFKELFAIETIPTVVDAKTYTHAVSIQSVRGVVDTTNKKSLRRTTIENFHRYDVEVTGQPEIWAREGGLIYVWPVPDAVYSLNILHQRIPIVLGALTDSTVLNSIWDQAILLLAAKSALIIKGDVEKTGAYLELARNYIGSRISDQGADANAHAQGVDVAWTESDITEQR